MKPLGSADPKSVGPFQLLGVLGAGGMGRVYLGTSRTGRRVAIKVIRPDLAEDSVFRDRFTREVAAARRVSPLFTAAVVDADTMAEAPWLATTYIEGVSLDRRVLDDGPMDADEVLSLAAGLGEALTSIHSVGLVHRDLKPSNILLNDSGPHIIDFGLALGSEQSRLTTSLVVGTPSYMAPERLRGEEAGTPSDIFSLGATLVFAATGRDLVDDANVYEQVLQIAEARFDLSDVPARMRAIVVRCVSYAPHDRPTAAELTRFVVALGAAAPGGGVDDVTVKIATKRRAEARAAGVPVRTTPRRPGDPDTPEIVVPAVPAAVVAARAGDAEVTADAGQGSGEGASKDRTTGGSAGAGTPVASTSTPVRAAGVSTPTPPGDPSIPAQPTGHTGDTPARPGSGGGSTPGRSVGIPSAAFSPWPNAPSTNDASTDSDADTPHHVAAFAPAADFDPRGVMKPNGALRNGTSGSGTSGNGTSANGAASNGTSANGASGNGDSHASAPRVAVGTVVGDG
ncbi:MAG TPA: protein kinase, partial [Micromonosporaceae bacterium]